MNNPYQALELEPNATTEQVKAAYSYLQKKYHPDNYESGPLKDLAIEKTEEITRAFDQIMNERRLSEATERRSGQTVSATANEQGQTATDQTQSYYSNADFHSIRTLIQQNQLVEAEQRLDQINQGGRNAEWYFLKGSVFFSRGWMEQAAEFFSTATRLDPNNNEYRAAFNRVNWQRQGNFGSPQSGPYRPRQANYGGCGMCDVCSGLLCADCCCECMGGDFISCC